MFKSYSSKSAANKGAKRAGATEVVEVDGKWGFYEDTQVVPEKVANIDETEADLNNNEQADWDASDEEPYDRSLVVADKLPAQPFAAYLGKKEEEAKQGIVAAIAPSAAAGAGAQRSVDLASRTLKIKKDREERNGVKRPSPGGFCAAVWDFCDEMNSGGVLPTAADVRNQADAHNWNANNASIEYYNWRKFMGIRGRQKVQSTPAQDA